AGDCQSLEGGSARGPQNPRQQSDCQRGGEHVYPEAAHAVPMGEYGYDGAGACQAKPAQIAATRQRAASALEQPAGNAARRLPEPGRSAAWQGAAPGVGAWR